MKKIAFSALFAAVAALTAFADAGNEVNSVNTFGVMKIPASSMTNAFAVPFGGFSATGDATNTLSTLLQKTALDIGTTAYIWDPANNKYDVYLYTTNDTETVTNWVSQTVLQVQQSGVSVGEGVSDAEKLVATGTGFFLVFPSAEDKRYVYLFGQALTNNYDTVTVAAGKTALIAPASTNCGSVVSLKDIDGTPSTLNSYGKIIKAGDSIQMLGGGKIYYRIGSVWKYKPKPGEEEYVDYWTWVEATELDLQPGCAFWYTNKGSSPIRITLTPAPAP